MSGISSANNSWTILTPEETVAETLRPLAEGTEHHEESLTSAAAGPGESRPAEGAEGAEGAEAEELPEEGHHLLSEDKAAELSEDTGTEQQPPVPAAVTEAPPPSSLKVSDSLVPGSDELSQSEGLPEGPAGASPDPDSFSDSYTHITPSPDEPPASLLSTETLGGGELIEEVERLVQEEALHSLNGEELQYEGEESDLFPRTADLGKQADSPGDSEVGKERPEKTGEEPEPEVRRRRSLLAALERIGRADEEEEEFQLPRRDDDSGFSVNKCILGALILLGLGTIFLSGVFMDLDEESDYGTMELKDAKVPGKQEWLNLEVPPLPVDADSTELLNRLDEGNQQISVLQAQLQAQGEELKVAKGHAAEGAKERLCREEVEEENSRLKKEMASLPVLQKENERMKRELESVPALQKELETLTSTVTELKLPPAAAPAPVTLTTPPSSVQPEDSTQEAAGPTDKQLTKPWEDQKETKKDVKKDTHDMGEKKEWNDGGKAEGKNDLKDGGEAEGKNELKDGGEAEGKHELKDGGKAEGKKGKHEQGKFEKEKDKEGKLKKASDETKQWKEKDLKKEKSSRGDEGKPWKDKAEKKEWKGKSEGKDWNKGKHEKVKEGKQWSGKEVKKDWKVGKDRGEKNKGKEEWKKGGRDGSKESGKGKWEKEDRKEWVKKESDWKGKNSKDHGKGKGEKKEWEERKHPERKGKEERKQWKDGKDEKEWKRKDEKKQWEKTEEPWKRGGEKDRKHNGDRKKDASSSQKHKSNGHKNHKEEPLWADRKPPPTHSRPSLDQPEYWEQQRDRLQQNPKATQQCSSVETCAQAEGLLPVPLPQFEAILQTYLSRAEEAGVAASKTDELKKLAAMFFKEGFFVHEQTSFTEFVEDLEDILEDMVEGDDAEEEDSDLEDEMEEFGKEVLKKFAAPVVAVEKEGRAKGEGRKERGRG
ncbi:hypothetical protein OYC64_014709 [Pagothenia borchgrevinki]|uniref:Pre-B-cell leukemia transcription factor-interacting protein 1 n=1 Tax=Pagothenia borchgrevinki TaxID=8213 RepID=A0ABD2H1N9_PAGBO